MELLDDIGTEWQSFDDIDVASESIPSVRSGSFSKQESADDSIILPDVLPATVFPASKYTWNSNEEVAAVLMAFDHHDQWLHRQLTTRPFSGSLFLYNRKEIKFRQDGYVWKTGKRGKLREDHMKLKIGGVSCIYGLYAHSAILSTFHRRCYWLLARPNVILVHYLNVIPKDDAIKLSIGPTSCLSSASSSSSISADNFTASSPPSSFWLNRDGILQQLCPMFGLPFPMHSNMVVTSILPSVQHGEESLAAMQQRFDMLSRLVDVALPSRQQPNATMVESPNVGVFSELQPCVSTTPASHRLLAGPPTPATNSSRVILPKSVCDNSQQMDASPATLASNSSYQQPQHQALQTMPSNQAMPPPPPLPVAHANLFGTATNSNNNGSIRSNKRPLDPNVALFESAQSINNAFANGVQTPYIFWNSSQLQQVQQPFQNNLTSHNQQQPQSHGYTSACEQETSSTATARRVSGSATCQVSQSHDILSSTYSAPPSCVPLSTVSQQISSSSSSALPLSGRDDSVDFFSSFASSGNDPEMLFPSFEFSSNEVEELLQMSSSPLQSAQHQSMHQSSLSSMMIVDHEPHVQFQVHTNNQQQPLQTSSHGTSASLHSDQNSLVSNYLPGVNARAGNSYEFSLIRIKDIAPQSAFVRGGVKVLIAGRWPSACRCITVSFGKTTVPATVLQPGLLKCYCPAVSQPGAVDLVVCCDGVVRSNPCTFYYRRQHQIGSSAADPSSSPSTPLLAPISPGISSALALNPSSFLTTNSDNILLLKLQLLELLQQLKDTLKPGIRLGFDVILRSCNQQVSCSDATSSPSTVELLAVAILTEITSNLPPPDPSLTQTVQAVDANNWTVLHFAAALNYTMLAEYMLDLRLQSKLPPVVEQQADVEARDLHGLTPLHVACTKANAAVTLFRRAPHLIGALNGDGINPVGMAAAAGHYDLVRVMQSHEDTYLNHLEAVSVPFGDEIHNSGASSSVVTFIGGNTNGDADQADGDSSMAAATLTDESNSNSWPYDAASQHMFDLATHIIAALPERIKQIPSTAYLQPVQPALVAPVMSAASASSSDAFVVYRERSASHGSHVTGVAQANTPLGDSGLSTPHSFSFEAPESTNSPQQQQGGSGSVRNRSPPPTPEQFNEYFNAPTYYLHHDFSHLTLTDDEQRRLYEAARVIQQAYRRYRESKLVPTSSTTSRQNSLGKLPLHLQTAQDQVLGILKQHDYVSSQQLHEQFQQQWQRHQSVQQNLLQQVQQPPLNLGHHHQQLQQLPPQKLELQKEKSNLNSLPLEKASDKHAASLPTVLDGGAGKGCAGINSSEALTPSDDKTPEVEQAALVIQAYYRRYKQFVAYRKMTEAATVIQSQFRSYSAQKRFRQSRDAARVIQNQYRMYRATNQRRAACNPYRTGSGSGLLGSSRRRSGSTSSSSSLAGLSHGTVNLLSGPVFIQSNNSCDAGPLLSDSYVKMDTWSNSAISLQQQQKTVSSTSNNSAGPFHIDMPSSSNHNSNN